MPFYALPFRDKSASIKRQTAPMVVRGWFSVVFPLVLVAPGEDLNRFGVGSTGAVFCFSNDVICFSS